MAKRLSSLLPSVLTSDRRKSSDQDAQRRPSADVERGRPQYAKHLPPLPPGQTHQRAASAHFLAPPIDAPQPSLYDLRNTRNASLSNLSTLQPPPPIAAGDRSRSPSLAPSSRGTSPALTASPGLAVARLATPEPRTSAESIHTSPTTSMEGATEKKRHYLSRKKVAKEDKQGPYGWIAGHKQKIPYDIDGLINAQPVPELCDDADGNCFVFFWPNGSGKGATCRIDSAVFAASPILTKLALGSAQRRQSINANGRINTQLFLPLKFKSPKPPTSTRENLNNEAHDDIQTLVDFRNFFGFLCGSSLIATERKPTLFAIFSTIAGILQSYEFSNVDGSTFGEVASTSFDGYIAELGLADVRTSREKTIEALILAERMKSVLLYNEAFTHAAGKYDELLALKNPKWPLISASTQTRLTRASMDLEKRIATTEGVLKDFDFPALFSGIMNSKVSEERKEGVVFGGWKDAFVGIRKFVLGLYNHRYGSWPPKAKSKKNDLETSGLNRRVLRDVYRDMSSMYDLLVDRNSLTTRTANGIDLAAGREDPITRALRSVLSEYDRSYPPVKPPVPFDLPKLPDMRTTRTDATGDPMKDSKWYGKKLKDDEIKSILKASHNEDAVKNSPFVEAFWDFEKRAAHGCTIGELIDLRIGQWIFMYVVLQALPLLACDAPVVKHTSGVEYFLCEPPRRGVPWAHAAAAAQGRASGLDRQWFSVGDGSGVVELPADLIEHGIDGIYRRSHCWVMAEQWSANNPILNEALHEQERMTAGHANDLQPPPNATGYLTPDSRSGSPGRNSKRMSTIGIGLDPLPIPPTLTPDGRTLTPDRSSFAGSRSSSRTPVHNFDSTRTFDSILASTDTGKKGRKK